MKSHMVTGVVAVLAALGAMLLASPEADADVWVLMPECQFEDGNPDGKPCLWIDPDTGKGYVSLSESYR